MSLTDLGPGLRAWFGDSAVRLVGGVPRLVYHGTAIKGTTFDTPARALPRGAFTIFDRAHLGAVTESSDAEVGFWFTSDEDRAWMAAEEAKAVGHGDSAYVYRVFLRILKPLIIPNVRDLDPEEVAEIAIAARSEGYDGLIFNQGEGEGTDYLVFHPNQIKSAHANVGTFDLHRGCICA